MEVKEKKNSVKSGGKRICQKRNGGERKRRKKEWRWKKKKTVSRVEVKEYVKKGMEVKEKEEKRNGGERKKNSVKSGGKRICQKRKKGSEMKEN